MNLFGWDDGAPAKKGRRKKVSPAVRLRRRMRRERQSGGGGGSAPEFAKELLDLHNEARPANYRLNADLCESAQGKAKDMDRPNEMYHERQWWKRLERAGYEYRTCGENIGEDFSTAGGVFEAWMNSPTHRKNIMNGEFTEIGFGYSGGYWCAHFGDR